MKNEKIVEAFKLEEKNGQLVGEHRGYLYSFTKYTVGSIAVDALCVVVDGVTSLAVLKTIRKATKSVVYVDTYQKRGDTLLIVLPKKSKVKHMDDVAYFAQLRDNIFETLKEQNLLPLSKCVLCDKDKEEDVQCITHGNKYVTMHESCKKEYINKVKETVETEKNKNDLVMGSVLFAIIGAIIGMIPLAFLLFATGSYYGILYALVPLASFFGYKLGKAPRTKGTIVLVVVLSLIMVIAFEYLQWNMIALAEEITFTQLFAIEGVKEQAIEDFLFSLLFMAVGIWISWKYISQTTESKLEDIKGLE